MRVITPIFHGARQSTGRPSGHRAIRGVFFRVILHANRESAEKVVIGAQTVVIVTQKSLRRSPATFRHSLLDDALQVHIISFNKIVRSESRLGRF
jgi:hypothetical protein